MIKFFIKIKLWLNKRYALQEVRTDIRFIEIHRKEMLKLDEKKTRQQMYEEKAKEEKGNAFLIETLEQKIKDHMTVKAEYRDLKQLEGEISAYLKEIWKV